VVRTRIGPYELLAPRGGRDGCHSIKGQTCENQLIELHRHCAARGREVMAYVDKGISGAKDRRPARPLSYGRPPARRDDELRIGASENGDTQVWPVRDVRVRSRQENALVTARA